MRDGVVTGENADGDKDDFGSVHLANLAFLDDERESRANRRANSDEFQHSNTDPFTLGFCA